MSVTVQVRGDFNGKRQGYTVYVNGTNIGRIDKVKRKCDQTSTHTFLFDSSLIVGPAATVTVVTDRSTSRSNGVNTSACTTNAATIKLRSDANTYLGTVQDAACGVSNKWQQAKSAIDTITRE